MLFFKKPSEQYTLLFKIIQILVVTCPIFCVKINKLQVPEVVHPGHPVVLDCDYTLEESQDQGLVLKWFFNDQHKPVYQWIPNIQPKVLGILKGRLNLNYSASKDLNSRHRALHIIQLGPDLSGNYTCLVSTVYNEDQKTKRMLVFVPEKRLELSQRSLANGSVQVICYAEGVFPKPNMNLLMGNREINDSVMTIEERGRLFDVKTIVEMPKLKVPEEFSCELRVPQANYSVSRKAIYYPVNNSSDLPVSKVFLFAAFYVLFIG